MIMKRISVGLLAVIFIISAAGCNTMRGAGQDVENAGKGVQRTVDRND
jgi:predicted small secreted protein